MIAPPPVILDLSRSVSRLGKGAATGIDRVERAWLEHLLDLPGTVLALVRIVGGFCLLDRTGMAALHSMGAEGVPALRPALRPALVWRRDPIRARAETAVRRLAIDAASRGRVGRLLRHGLSPGFVYLNLGHSNLDARIFAAIRSSGGRSGALIHDTIPLDHPELVRPDRIAPFARAVAAAAAADRLICNSAHTAERLVWHIAGTRSPPPVTVAHLGVDPPGVPGPLPEGVARDRPVFLALGTIEPRKNLALLLDVWQALARSRPAGALPQLVIAGRRGWAGRDLLARLDERPVGVLELSDVDDGARAALFRHATALLFPSRAEGFGLPPAEAAAAGLAVVSAPLPSVREVLGDYPVYVDASDGYAWQETILRLASGDARPRAEGAGRDETVRLPTWAAHFRQVLSLFSEGEVRT
ncbi:MAG: glycosyltransferase [Gemmobacter sp.]